MSGAQIVVGQPLGDASRSPYVPPPGVASRFAFLGTSGALAPSATSATYGTGYTFLPDNGFAGFLPFAVDIVAASVGSETLTFQTIATYNDATTTTVASVTATSSSTVSLTAAQLLALLAGADGRYLVSLAVNVKSSISSSGATATFNVVGLSLS